MFVVVRGKAMGKGTNLNALQRKETKSAQLLVEAGK